jgi:hypothetical protein
MRDRKVTPGSIIRMVHEGYGVDDIRARTKATYRDIALACETRANLAPWARLAWNRAGRDAHTADLIASAIDAAFEAVGLPT